MPDIKIIRNKWFNQIGDEVQCNTDEHMKLLLIIGLVMNANFVLVDFNQESTLENWFTVDDVVMGGRSSSRFEINEQGHAVFSGNVSLDNNGGFSSLRHVFEILDMKSFQTITLRVKGDGLRYQLRVKSSRSERHSYTYSFDTSGTWQWIEIPLSEMSPTWRGSSLNYPNYPAQTLEEIGILIGNKIPEAFQLEIDKILLK